ncbi:hypothetical protein B0H14DRAFT_3426771 [Mycena olivaceomarginata]|nr:hypothetical protein B0H14DRAFT_3426771 [Mycena olivaceomarginata]
MGVLKLKDVDGQNERKRRSRAKAEAENPRAKKHAKVDVVLKHRETASRGTVAEGSRPAREIKKNIKADTRKPQGPKKKADRPGKYINWLTPFSWSAITAAQLKVGWHYTGIVKELQRSNYDFYQHLSVTTVPEWVETIGRYTQWKPKVLAQVTRGNIPGHNKGGHRGILAPYPELVKEIMTQLADIRSTGAPIFLATVRCVIIALIQTKAPEIFLHHQSECSDSTDSEHPRLNKRPNFQSDVVCGTPSLLVRKNARHYTRVFGIRLPASEF